MKLAALTLAGISLAFLSSCVSTSKFNAMQKEQQDKYNALNSSYTKSQGDLNACNTANADLTSKNNLLSSQLDNANKQLDALKQNNSQLLKQLQDLSVISSSQAESIKKSLDNIGAKDAYIMDLQSAIARKDSLNMNLVMNLKSALANVNDQDINIKVDKGVVYIDISDKLLFNSGSYVVSDKAKEVLGKVALVLKNQPDIEFMVEGHTDSVRYSQGVLMDNWDLSVKRATSVIRILQNQYNLPPAHMTAAGRSEYLPVASNDTEAGRAANRRTRIVILPQLDQFFKLLEKR